MVAIVTLHDLFAPHWVEENGTGFLMFGGVQLAEYTAWEAYTEWTAYDPRKEHDDRVGDDEYSGTEEAKAAAEQAVAEWLFPVMKALAGEPVAQVLPSGVSHDFLKVGMKLYALPKIDHET